ncbi:U4/U6 small nuclear ribonucleoprotein prp4 [Sporothrix epigloea]|uniref:non-specific serine/threonine protein kinase n=1 Tax=Sporothrix epigloea TaxID=1892477 RepID=A0ABP0DU11_9PEZI
MASPTSSADEGEIVERHDRQPHLKAKTSAATSASAIAARSDHGRDSFNVDRRNRIPRGRSSRSPDRLSTASGGYTSRNYPSPPRGQKRQRDDRDRDRGRDRDRLEYEDYPRRRSPPRLDYDSGRRWERDDRDRSRAFYRDNDQLRYDDDDYSSSRFSRNAHSKRQRTRSRSPPPKSSHPSSSNYRGSDRWVRNERDHRDRDRDFERNRDRQASRDDRGRDRSQDRNQDLNQTRNGDRDRRDRAVDRHSNGDRQGAGQVKDAHKGQQQPEPTPELQEDWVELAPVDEEAEIQRRRQRRQEILQKSRVSTPMRDLSLAASTPAATASPVSQSAASPNQGDAEALDLVNDRDFIHMLGKQNAGSNGALAGDVEDGPSAADYDPTADMEEDERRDELRHGGTAAGLHGADRREALTAQHSDQVEPVPVTDTTHKDSKDAKDNDVEDDEDEDDMFAEDFVEKKYDVANAANDEEAAGKNGTAPAVGTLPAPAAAANAGGILEGDDIQGYYKIRRGEVLDDRYQIQSSLGKGMFSGVARAWDITTPERREVAIKIMRNNDALRKGGYTEIAILRKLNESDPENRKHIVRFERSFEFRGHLCMAFENLSMNLREVLKKFGNNVGINLQGVRVYAYQIFVALAHMRRCSIIHADLKPDNILVNGNRSTLKICDLGTAIDRSDAATAHMQITPYLVSRFYRAPEIVLGMPYDYAVDMWSIGCTLYELYTGKILFTGESNNQMLRAIMEIRGKMSAKLYRRGELWRMHFDDNGGFLSQEHDKFQGKTTIKTIPVIKPTRDLRTRLLAASVGMSDAESRDLGQFHDLLDRCLNLNPDKRILPSDALKHPFFTSRS